MNTKSLLTRIAVPVLSLGLLGGLGTALAGAASASIGPASNGQVGQVTGHNAANYQDPVFGHVQCNETQHPAFDTVSCKFVDGQLLPAGQTGSVGWNSDFGNKSIHSGVTGTLTYTVNPDGAGY